MALRAAAKRLTSSIVSRHGATGEGIVLSCNALVCFCQCDVAEKQRSTLGTVLIFTLFGIFSLNIHCAQD